MATAIFANTVREHYLARSAEMEIEFRRSRDGWANAQNRAKLVDEIVRQLCAEAMPQATISVSAMGGYGRGLLSPYSDVDLVFLYSDAKQDERYKEATAAICRSLWDMGIRANATARVVRTCGEFDPRNMEFTVALLESRLVGGQPDLLARVQRTVLPELIRTNRDELVSAITESATRRHSKYADTIYHLEPQVKDGPGGLRDVHLALWLHKVGELSAEQSPVEPSQDLDSAHRFLLSVRSFLHYLNRRDDNLLTWDAQDEAAAQAIGVDSQVALAPGDWMREYFRNARVAQRAALHAISEASATKQRSARRWSRARNEYEDRGLHVQDGVLTFLPGELDMGRALTALELVSAQPVRFAAEALSQLSALTTNVRHDDVGGLWPRLSRILCGQHAAEALRGMRDSGLLACMVPEFAAIDALVIRDMFHRYTVDEHSFLTIDRLHRLHGADSDLENRLAGLLSELQQPELLYLALLLHDFGKGCANEDHVAAGLRIAQSVMQRLGVPAYDGVKVNFLVQHHLDLSAAIRRDIFDLQNVAAVAQSVESPELLKMLTLLTYADISSVNPEAMTPWKREDLWHLYAACDKFLSHHADGRLHLALHRNDRSAFQDLPERTREDLENFLEGLPERYLQVNRPDNVLRHLALARKLKTETSAVELTTAAGLYEVTVVTKDRPVLFAAIADLLARWRMDVVRANAFSNAAGVVVDVFSFKDRYRTLELNPGERERLIGALTDVLRTPNGATHSLRSGKPQKRRLEAKVIVDGESSASSTVLEVVAQDRPGLLRDIACIIAECACNIEIALVETEGQIAYDVFYLTHARRRLTADLTKELQQKLLEALQ